jgi:MFS transporter, putative metabolite:H+ symporter
MIRYWIPESPRFLMRMGRFDEARKALAWALKCDPKEIELPDNAAEIAVEKTSWLELFRYPRSMFAACAVALSQTGGVGILMWITALFVMVLKITPAEASYLMIWVGVLGIFGRIIASWMSDAFGRRWSGFLIGAGGAVAMALAGYLHDVYVGTVSLFFVLIMVQRFFGDASYAIIGPYLAEVWPNRLRASGMGFCYGIGNLGKIIGPLGLALVIGTSDYVSPKATVDAILPALLFLAFWYGQAALVFLFFAIETKNVSIEEMDSTLSGGRRKPSLATAGSATAG